MPKYNELYFNAMRNPMNGAPSWHGPLEEMITDALDVLADRDEDWTLARMAAVEALIGVAASFGVHHIDFLTHDGDVIPGALDAAIDDFANAARIAMMGEIRRYDLTDLE